MMKPRLALIGAGGFAKEVAEVAQMSGFDVTGVYALDAGEFAGLHRGYLDEVLRDRREYDGVAIGVGAVDRRSLARRRALIEWVVSEELACPPLVSQHCVRAVDVEVQSGAFAGHGVVLGVGAVLRPFAIVNAGAIVGHDTVIGTNAIIAPGAFIGGAAVVGEDTLIGPLAKVLQGLQIGCDVVLGVGCTALRSLQDGATVWPRPDRAT